MSNVMLVIVCGIRIVLLLRCSWKVIREEEEDGKIWIEDYVHFILDFFMCNLGMHYVKN